MQDRHERTKLQHMRLALQGADADAVSLSSVVSGISAELSACQLSKMQRLM